MKKSDLVAELADKAGLSKKDAKDVLDWLENRIMEGVKSGDEMVLDIGKFQMKKVPAREGINPATGAKIKIAAKTKPVFKPSKKFKDSLS
jgi:DNA-binding protein HU-beta